MIRLLSGLVLAAVALAAILFLPVPLLRVLAGAVAFLAALEYLRLTRSDRRLAAVAFVTCVIAADGSPFSLALAAMIVIVAVSWQVLARGEGAHRASAGGFSGLYIGVPLGLLVATHARYGWRATLLLIATVVVSDTAQFYTGRMFGRRPLAPAISPKKTVEGAIGGVAFGTLFAALAGPQALPGYSVVALAGLGLVVVALGICGDLFESQIKREAGVKDSGDLIPGHGGALDRIDALLFAAPAFYIYLGMSA